MNISKLLPVFFLLLFAACNSNQEQNATATEDGAETAQTTNLERNEGTRDWDEAWNNNDLQALRDMTANDAVLLLNTQMRTGEDIDSWFEANASVMQNLETTSEISNEGENMAYEAGTYTHGVEGSEEEFSGIYSIVWERTNEDWEIKVINIGQREAEADVVEN